MEFLESLSADQGFKRLGAGDKSEMSPSVLLFIGQAFSLLSKIKDHLRIRVGNYELRTFSQEYTESVGFSLIIDPYFKAKRIS